MIKTAIVYLPIDKCLEFVVGSNDVVSINNYKDTTHLVVKFKNGMIKNFFNIPFSYEYFPKE